MDKDKNLFFSLSTILLMHIKIIFMNKQYTHLILNLPWQKGIKSGKEFPVREIPTH